MAQANPIVDPVVPALPRRAGELSLWAHLARGGMADVFVANDALERVVAVKCVRSDLQDSPQAARLATLLLAEARLTECLRHPNIVRVLGHGCDEAGWPYLALEYVEGLDLHALLAGCAARKIELPLAFRLSIVCGVLRALDYAHRARDDRGALFEVVHRDISPGNVLIGFDGAVKLCDFGIASATVMPDLAGAVEGKASYMSPEHARGESVDQRADLYACGILLWELVSGRRMRRKGEDRLARARRGEIPPLALRGLPDEERLVAIVRRALSLHPDDRYPSASAMMREIERWCRENGMRAGESEIGRFVREHFRDRFEELRRMREGRASLLPVAPSGDPTPTRSGPRKRKAPAPALATRAPRSWLSFAPVLAMSGIVTLALLTVLSWLGVY